MSATEDGFVIAEKDLEIRGPGDFFGTRQWGMPAFRVGHLIRDRDLLERARTEAFRWVEEPPTEDAGALRAFLEQRGWERRVLAGDGGLGGGAWASSGPAEGRRA